jgi:hypothetical protein
MPITIIHAEKMLIDQERFALKVGFSVNGVKRKISVSYSWVDEALGNAPADYEAAIIELEGSIVALLKQQLEHGVKIDDLIVE